MKQLPLFQRRTCEHMSSLQMVNLDGNLKFVCDSCKKIIRYP